MLTPKMKTIKTISVQISKSNKKNQPNFDRSTSLKLIPLRKSNSQKKYLIYPPSTPSQNKKSTQKYKINFKKDKTLTKKSSLSTKKLITQQTNFPTSRLPINYNSKSNQNKNTSYLQELVSSFHGQQFQISSQPVNTNWQQIIETKKKELYTHLYNIDRKLINSKENNEYTSEKKNICNLIKKKCSENKTQVSGRQLILRKNVSIPEIPINIIRRK